MFPTNEISKGASKEFKALIIIATIVWLGFTIVHARTQYKLAKMNIKKLESEGFK